ncbi:hypothetical protein SLEP1_g1630 [Rubroshorea leprosula]|uniref:Uncharacterized protein n=1 Tax=Rubroshorea leprosula TaxID=152421 RepID=A0AAV5HNY0_9ROSI|nr:hypothetical protein SLEP1_g1630 [Rubroshorea leprosula]
MCYLVFPRGLISTLIQPSLDTTSVLSLSPHPLSPLSHAVVRPVHVPDGIYRLYPISIRLLTSSFSTLFVAGELGSSKDFYFSKEKHPQRECRDRILVVVF